MEAENIIHQDYDARVVVRPADWVFRPSPVDGVDRVRLERNGGEKARATTLVRFAPEARFDEHTHEEGEEFFVVEGDVADDQGHYEAGDYVRNPPGSRHALRAGASGAALFVKLRYFARDDQERVHLAARARAWSPGLVEGLRVSPLHEHGGVGTALVAWAPHTRFQRHRHRGGEEIFVVDGVFRDEHGAYPAGTWIRSPHQSVHEPFTGPEGALILVKVGHLLSMEEGPRG